MTYTIGQSYPLGDSPVGLFAVFIFLTCLSMKFSYRSLLLCCCYCPELGWGLRAGGWGLEAWDCAHPLLVGESSHSL